MDSKKDIEKDLEKLSESDISVEDMIRLRDEYGVDVAEQLDPSDLNISIEIPREVLMSGDVEVNLFLLLID